MQARERQLHVGLDPHRPDHGQVRCRRDQILEHGGLPDSGLTADDQRPAFAAPDVVDQGVEHGALVGSPEQAHTGQPPMN
jgi:hypothetical protein